MFWPQNYCRACGDRREPIPFAAHAIAGNVRDLPRKTLLQRCRWVGILRKFGPKASRFLWRERIIAFQTSFEVQDPTFPANVIGSRTGATMMHPCESREPDNLVHAQAISRLGRHDRTTPGGQRTTIRIFAIETALTLRAVFRLALRQSEA